MRAALISALAAGAAATRPFINEPDTAIELSLPDLAVGALPELEKMVGIPDFEYAARNYLPARNYTYYRNGAAGEWSYRNNLEVFGRYRFRPRTMVDITNVESTLPTTILGHNFSAPIFISPAARADYGHVDAELNLMRAAGAENILYMPALFAAKTIEQIAEVKTEGQVAFQQVYLGGNDTATQIIFDRIKASGAQAIVYTIDSPADGNRHRAARFGVGSADSELTLITWDVYRKYTTMTDLPIILKGIMTVEDAEAAIENNVPAIVISNHGGRQLDGSPSALEIALEIYEKDPSIFQKIEVYADGGVRYGADVLKLLSLGVKAVGLGRPFMFANIFGQEGVEKAIQILKREVAMDAGNLGVADLKKIDSSFVKWTPNNWYS
ncbi:FMN-dependent dehydrogenase [Colletotrichum higginsianum IMI 349063]|uniref:FMN-dependent dehydrogenase n=2 Tax=Colletotrichum higginsianum TaxID=80884 RepID=A0A1B7YR34_COLHI|nr:FMN-dependent dehydrogenase [Colletotrichum higginsianum IMI 349063]OBR14509.1 FMN-dependent dehydrogenase [Colletotrichum higginsianum IMI 349063]TID01599.1 Cytochrome b2, mitochondrial [Colletotrichum higginsianum]